MKKQYIFLIVAVIAIAGYLYYRWRLFGYGSNFYYPGNELNPTNMFGFGKQPTSYDAITNTYTYS